MPPTDRRQSPSLAPSQRQGSHTLTHRHTGFLGKEALAVGLSRFWLTSWSLGGGSPQQEIFSLRSGWPPKGMGSWRPWAQRAVLQGPLNREMPPQEPAGQEGGGSKRATSQGGQRSWSHFGQMAGPGESPQGAQPSRGPTPAVASSPPQGPSALQGSGGMPPPLGQNQDRLPSTWPPFPRSRERVRQGRAPSGCVSGTPLGTLLC